MEKYLKFFEDKYDGNELIWKKGKSYKVTYSTNSIYYVESESNSEDYGVEKESEDKKYTLVERNEE